MGERCLFWPEDPDEERDPERLRKWGGQLGIEGPWGC